MTSQTLPDRRSCALSQGTVSCFGKPKRGQEEEEELLVEGPQGKALLWVLGPAVTEQDNPTALGPERSCQSQGLLKK